MIHRASHTSLRRDTKLITAVSVAHAFSHFFQLALPPLFPILHSLEGYSYTELGMSLALFYLASGLVQPIAGFIVDRLGPRIVLYLGMGTLAGATALFSICESYSSLAGFATLAGVGNGVFHPSDYTLLSRNVSIERIGRGFSFHAFGGYAGYAIAPVSMIALATSVGWREATLIIGLSGLLLLTLLIFLFHRDLAINDRADKKIPNASNNTTGILLRPVIVGCFLFFCLIAMAQIGLQTFAPPALMVLHGTSIAVSNLGVTIFLIGVTAGILLGGIIADRTDQHHLVTILCLIPAATLSSVPGLLNLPIQLLWTLFALIGFALGLLIPSRDMLVRAAAPLGASGRVFGIVYSGLDVGSAVTPIVFGWLMDQLMATEVFCSVGVCFGLGIMAILLARLPDHSGVANKSSS